ncbi:hypothetical protein DID96_32695, partial [Burkholderia sp. Bp8963]|uniref:T6SS effector BTH_I2691 family protein n=1 Tax=Burkholderia sp. Bp8963 TaxID=2184547 RepID=UPI000FB9C6BF
GGVLGLGGWTLSIGDPEDVDEARLLFTYDPLSPAMVDRYRDVSLYRDRLQKFDLRTLAQTCSNFDDVVDPHSLDTTVAEFRAAGNPDAKQMLEKQAFPPFRNALAPGDAAKDMGSIYHNARDSLKGNGGVALVLYDAVGIVQELNAWRNDAIEINLPWLKAMDAEGISNERRHAVAEALDDIKLAMQKNYVETAVQDAATTLESAKYRARRNQARFGVSFENLEEQAQRHDPERVRARAAKESAHAFDRYQDMLDWDGAKARVQTEFARRDKLAQQEMDKREADHLAWLDSDLLKHALDLYDRKDPVWGEAFASQIGLCLLGMNGCNSGTTQLTAWWSDTAIDKHNLGWRALTRNQISIEEETRIAFAKAKAAEVLTAENMVEVLGTTSIWFEKVADLFIKSDAAVQAAVGAGTYRWFDPQRLTLALPLFAYLHQHLFRMLPANAVDRHLLAPMVGFVHTGLGAATTRLRMRELAAAGQTANTNRVAGQVNSHIGRVRNTLTTEFQNGGGGQFYQIRAGVILAIIEGVILFVKSTKKDEGERERLEFKAAFLITAAAGIELAAVSVETVTRRYAPTGVVGRGAAIALGGLRLGGGVLATVGGAYMVVMDIEDTAKALHRGQWILAQAYRVRAVVSAGITALSATVSFSYSGPLLRWLLGANSRASVILIAEGLAGSRLMPLFLTLMTVGTLTTLGISVAIAVLSPNEMEEWCWHSCFGKRKLGSFFKPYKDEKTELETLYKSFMAAN